MKLGVVLGSCPFRASLYRGTPNNFRVQPDTLAPFPFWLFQRQHKKQTAEEGSNEKCQIYRLPTVRIGKFNKTDTAGGRCQVSEGARHRCSRRRGFLGAEFRTRQSAEYLRAVDKETDAEPKEVIDPTAGDENLPERFPPNGVARPIEPHQNSHQHHHEAPAQTALCVHEFIREPADKQTTE